MSKKTFSIRLSWIFTSLILFFPCVIHAQQYYDQYPGNGFSPADDTLGYAKNYSPASIYHNNTPYADYFCPVTFNVPDGAVYFIKSIGIRYVDNLTDGYLRIILRRQNLYTGAVHTVVSWQSDLSSASPSDQTASQGTFAGVKLVDTKKFAYWLDVYFYGGAFVPGNDLILYQVRIHYGT